jgi:hypothetical protein
MTNKARVSHGKWWSPEEWAKLVALKATGKQWVQIGREMGRSPSSCSSKFAYECHASARDQCLPMVVHLDIPAEVIADARRRMEAPRTLSAMFFGDPPQGFSALDRMQNREAL